MFPKAYHKAALTKFKHFGSLLTGYRTVRSLLCSVTATDFVFNNILKKILDSPGSQSITQDG